MELEFLREMTDSRMDREIHTMSLEHPAISEIRKLPKHKCKLIRVYQRDRGAN
jgi:hypothetical protein